MPTFKFSTKCLGSPGIRHDHTPDCIDDLTTERSFSSQATWVIDVLGLFFDMLSMVVFKNMH